MSEELRQAALNSLSSNQKRDKKLPGLSPKKFQGVDANQGQLIVSTADGGLANVSSQTQLSNAAIQTGQDVAPYGWETADWAPTRSKVGGEDILEDGPPTSFEDQEEPDPDDLPPPLGDIPNLPPLQEPQGYCQCKIVWVRGTPRPEAPDEPPFDGGQCPGSLYRYHYAYNWIFSDGPNPETPNNFSVDLYGPLSPWSGTNPTVGVPGVNVVGVKGFLVSGEEVRQGIADPNLGDPEDPGTLNITSGPTVTVLAGPDDCGDFPDDNGPPGGTDPGDWTPVKSCNLPVGYSIEENGSKKYVNVADQSGTLARLGYNEDDDIDVRVRCAEEGPP